MARPLRPASVWETEAWNGTTVRSDTNLHPRGFPRIFSGIAEFLYPDPTYHEDFEPEESPLKGLRRENWLNLERLDDYPF